MTEKTNRFRSLIAASGQIAVAPHNSNSVIPGEFRSAQTTSALTNVRRQPGKRNAPDYTQVGAYIPKNLHNRVKMKLLQDGDKRNFSALIETLLSEYVANR